MKGRIWVVGCFFWVWWRVEVGYSGKVEFRVGCYFFFLRLD